MLNSNGTVVDGSRVTSAVLSHNATLSLGGTRLPIVCTDEDSMSEVVERGVETCTRYIFDRAADGTDAIYCSWDTDSMDHSCMPGTSCPESFGIKAREAIQIARIAGEYDVQVLELAELSPVFDASQISIKLACNLIYHFLGSRAAYLRGRGDSP